MAYEKARCDRRLGNAAFLNMGLKDTEYCFDVDPTSETYGYRGVRPRTSILK